MFAPHMRILLGRGHNIAHLHLRRTDPTMRKGGGGGKINWNYPAAVHTSSTCWGEWGARGSLST